MRCRRKVKERKSEVGEGRKQVRKDKSEVRTGGENGDGLRAEGGRRKERRR